MSLREYETVCIFKPYCTPEQVEKLVQKIKPLIDADGGTLLRAQQWGRKRLAYLIKKEREGLYICFYYVASAAKVREIEQIMKYDETVLKYLTVKRSDSVDLEAIKTRKEPEVPASFRQDHHHHERPEPRGEYRSHA